MLFLLRLSSGRSDGGPEVRFGVQVRNDNREGTPPLVRLKALCGPGGQGEPVVTIMLPGEDGPGSPTASPPSGGGDGLRCCPTPRPI